MFTAKESRRVEKSSVVVVFVSQPHDVSKCGDRGRYGVQAHTIAREAARELARFMRAAASGVLEPVLPPRRPKDFSAPTNLDLTSNETPVSSHSAQEQFGLDGGSNGSQRCSRSCRLKVPKF